MPSQKRTSSSPSPSKTNMKRSRPAQEFMLGKLRVLQILGSETFGGVKDRPELLAEFKKMMDAACDAVDDDDEDADEKCKDLSVFTQLHIANAVKFREMFDVVLKEQPFRTVEETARAAKLAHESYEPERQRNMKLAREEA